MRIVKSITKQHRGIYEKEKRIDHRSKRHTLRIGDKTYVYSAYLIDKESENVKLPNRFKRRKRKNLNFTGTDMIEFSITRDWVYDPDGITWRIRNHYVHSFEYTGQYLKIRIHGNYITHETNIKDFIAEQITKLALRDVFQIPITRMDIDDLTGEVLQEKTFSAKEPSSFEEFLEVILKQLTLQRIEFSYDRTTSLSDKFREGDFGMKDTTLYSLDYKRYPNGDRNKSMFTVYDKAKHEKDNKNVRSIDYLWRFEVRLLKSTGVLKKSENWMILLDGRMYDVFLRFRNRIRNYKNNRIPNSICLSGLILSIPADDIFLRLFQESPGCLHSWIKNKDKFVKERLTPIEPCEEHDEPIPYDFDELDWRLSVS